MKRVNWGCVFTLSLIAGTFALEAWCFLAMCSAILHAR